MDAATDASSPAIIIPAEWSEAANFIAYNSVSSPPPIVFICGAKNCGKSTFSRHLVNVLLHNYKKVAYLDTDVGQTKFAPPRCLSLNIIDKMTPDLAIPCMHTPERCYFYGDISSKRDPTVYLNCIFSLYDHYRNEYYTIDKSKNNSRVEVPIVINTPGWVKGIGYDILVEMLKYMSPSRVIKINISVESKNLPDGEFWRDETDDVVTASLIEISSARQDALNRSFIGLIVGLPNVPKHLWETGGWNPWVLIQKDARNLRDFRVIAYFRQCLSSNINVSKLKELAHALASHPPYEVPISSINIGHLHCQVTGSEKMYSLNASIVGLAVSQEDTNSPPLCVGLGIVRSIDSSRGLFYVITPVVPSILENVDTFLQGFIQIPTSLLQVQGCISPYMSANVLPII